MQCSENFNSDLHSRLQSPWFPLVTWPPSLRYKRNWVALGTRRSNHYNLVPRGCDPFAQHQITNLWKNPKNEYLWLADKTCSSHANYFAHKKKKKTVSTLIWFWQVICVHANLTRLEDGKEKFYLNINSWNHATTTFCPKMSCLVIESRSMPLLNTCMLLNLLNLHTAVLILSTKECVSSWPTNVSIPTF